MMFIRFGRKPKAKQHPIFAIAFNKVVILATVALVGVYSFRAEVPNFPSWDELSFSAALAESCEDRAGEGVETCIERGKQIHATMEKLSAELDAASRRACRERFGGNLDATWRCVKLIDGRDLAAVYRRPGADEGEAEPR